MTRMPAAPAKTRSRLRRAARCALLLLAGLSVAPAVMGQLIDVNQYIERFMQYVRWPDESSQSQSWRICVVGDAQGSALHFNQLTARGRPFSVQTVTPTDELRECHVLDLTRVQERSEQAAFLGNVQQLPVLSIGSGEDFCRLGGHICLTRGAARQFDLNISALQSAGLSVNARLLTLGQAAGSEP